jgi:hypothetical protein
MPLILTPLAHLPAVACSLSWFYLKVGMVVLAFRWTFRIIEPSGTAIPVWAKIGTVLLSLRPILGDLSHGNINIFILMVVVGALYAFSRSWDWTAGITLGLAIACKVTPALFIPYFVWKRAWSTVAGCAVGLVLFLWVVPGACLGMERNHLLLTSWYHGMVQPFVEGGEVTTEHINQSLPGLAFRLFTHSPSFYDKGVPAEYSNIASLDPAWIRISLKAGMAAFAILLMRTCRTPTGERNNWRLAAEYSLVLLGMLLFSERTWKHHCVTLVLPFGVVMYYLATCQPDWKLRYYLSGSLATAAAFMFLTVSGLQEDGDRFAKVAEANGAYVWAFMILAAALAVILRRPKGTDQQAARALPARAA